MPEVFILGEIQTIVLDFYGSYCLKYRIVTGNEKWGVLLSGNLNGSTMINSTNDGAVIVNHPIDVYFSSTSIEGFPYIVCEIWKLTDEGTREFYAIGCSWIPFNPGNHSYIINLWRVVSLEKKNYPNGELLPDHPNEIIQCVLNNHIRERILSDSIGLVSINLNIIVSGFEEFGVIL